MLFVILLYPHGPPEQGVEVARANVSPAVSDIVPVAKALSPTATTMRLPTVLFDAKLIVEVAGLKVIGMVAD